MAYIRISISTPKEGNRERVLKVEDQLLDLIRQQPGFIEAFRLESPTRVGRLSVWDAEESADRAATSQHMLALRSELLPLLAESQELAFEGDRVTR